MRVLFAVVLALLPAGMAFAGEGPPAFPASCPGDFAAMDASFEETQARLEAAGKGDTAVKCDAVKHHIEVMQNGIEVFLRCSPDGHDRRENIGQLAASIEDFQAVAGNLGCR